MHLSEFKAWFDGFTEEMDGTPTPKQWKKIKERVKEITADYTPPTIFVDRYYYPWRHHWDCVPYWAGTTGVGVSTTNLSAIGSAAGSSVQMADYKSAVSQQVSLSDWRQAGKAEFRAS